MQFYIIAVRFSNVKGVCKFIFAIFSNYFGHFVRKYFFCPNLSHCWFLLQFLSIIFHYQEKKPLKSEQKPL